MLELIDETPVTPGETRNAYDGYEASRAIIQDCEDSLTNWVSANAAVRPKLSTRSRTLSQRRRNNISKQRGEGVDLASQDQPLKGDRDSWVAAHQHASYHQPSGEDEEEEYGEEEATQANGEQRGREEERTPISV